MRKASSLFCNEELEAMGDDPHYSGKHHRDTAITLLECSLLIKASKLYKDLEETYEKIVTPHTKFEAQVYVLSKEEGGRHTPFFSNYRPQFYFRTTDGLFLELESIHQQHSLIRQS